MTVDSVPTELPDSPASADGGGTGGSDTTAEQSPRRRRRGLLVLLAILVVALLIVSSIAAWYLVTRKPLTALPGLAQPKVPHYSFSFYGVTAPLDVAMSLDETRIYVTESEGERLVRVFDRAGRPTGTLTPPPQGMAHLPVYLAVDPIDDEVVVSDRLSRALYVYGPDGTFRRAISPAGIGSTWQPLGIAFDRAGLLYVSDVSGIAHRIVVLSAEGAVVRTFGETDSLLFPNDIAVDGHGNVAVADSNNGRVVVFDPNGKAHAAVNRGIGDGDVGLPRGLAIGEEGQLFVVDTVNHTVRVYGAGDAGLASLTYAGSFGDAGSTDGAFAFPNGVTTDSRARVYITDRENNRVQVWTY
jgi:DNA-binding beta-propeller fold protein YncE